MAVITPATTPAQQARAVRAIEVDGVGRVEVSEEFFRLPPEQQAQAVEEIARYHRQQNPQPQAQVEPTPQDTQRLPDFLHQNAPFSSAGIEGLADFGAGAAQGAGEVLDNAAELAQGAYNQTAGRLFGQSDSATRTNEVGAGFEGAADQLGEGSEGGRVAGNIAASAFLTRGAGPVAQGAGQGALLSDADSAGELARDVAVGAVGGKVGERLVAGASRVIAPQIERGTRMLQNARVRVTPGQVIPALRPVEDRMMNWPFIGPGLIRQRREGFEDFARAIPREAHEVVRRIPGRNIAAMPENMTGQQAVRHAGDDISAVYNDVIPRLSLRADEELVAGIQGVGSRLEGEALSDAGRETFDRIVRRGVMGRFQGATVTGQQYQAADTFLERQIARLGRSDDPDNQLVAEGLRDLRAELRNGIVRQNGPLGRELEAADEAWAMLVPAETAAAGSPRGFFSPAQYRSALSRGDSRVRRRGMARGEVRGQEFAEAGQNVLPSQYPNPSGTGGQEAYNLADARFYMGAGANALYGRGVRDTITGAASFMDRIPQGLTQPITNALKAIPAPQAGALGADQLSRALFGF